jgi:hypothetical protein
MYIHSLFLQSKFFAIAKWMLKFEDNSMKEGELQECILNMTPYPNGEGNLS